MRKVEETENYIHIPVRSASDFVQDSFRTIDISESQGIKAVIGKLKSDPDGPTHVQKYLFDTSKWTVAEATEWVEEHKEKRFMNLTDKSLQKAVEGKVRYKGYPFPNKALMKDEKGALLVSGFFTDDQVDDVGDIITKQATEKAIEQWRRWGNIRTMHEYPSGTMVKIGEADGLEWNQVVTKPVESKTIELLEGGVLQAYSVGVIPTKWEINEEAFDEEDPFQWFFPPIIISEMTFIELSYVDIPANPRAVFAEIEMAKGSAEKLPPGLFAPKGRSAVIFKVSDDSPLRTGKEPDIVKAEWSTAAINSAKDLVFAAVEPTGEKDDEGKTVPRNARHLPHHDLGADSHNNENVDLPHYRNALSRANQIKPVTDTISQDALRSKADSHLDKHSSVLETEDGLDPVLFMDDAVWETFTKKYEPTLEQWLKFQAAQLEEKDMSKELKQQEPAVEEELEPVVEIEDEVPPDPLHELMLGLTDAVTSLTETLNTRFDNIELMLAKEPAVEEISEEIETIVEEEPVEDFPVHTQKVVEDKEPEEAKGLTAEDVGEMIVKAISESEERITKVIAGKLAELAKPVERKAIVEVESPETEDEEIDVRALTSVERKERIKELLDGHFDR